MKIAPIPPRRTCALTEHAARRMHQHGIRRNAVQAALWYGEAVEQNGATAFFLGRRHLPAGLRPAQAARLEGTTVVLSRDDRIVTVFRNAAGLRRVMRRRTRRSH
jgi:TPR repeat protein